MTVDELIKLWREYRACHNEDMLSFDGFIDWLERMQK